MADVAKTNKQKIDELVKDVQSLTFDNERIIKPAISEIREILSRDIYTTKVEHNELKADVKLLREELERQDEKTHNYGMVEKLVFGLVSLVLVTVVGAILALVVNKP